jgi:histidyl-tRNA synthetase
MGQERLVELMRAKGEINAAAPHIYLVMVGDQTTLHGLEIAEKLRRNIPTLRILANLGGGNFKAQFKRADRSGADLALVLGEEELKQSIVTIKPLRTEAGQRQVALEELCSWLSDWLHHR